MSTYSILNCGSDVIRPIVGSSLHQPDVAAVSVCVHGRPYKFCIITGGVTNLISLDCIFSNSLHIINPYPGVK